MKQVVIIVAGGSGKRMNTDIPKQFLLLNEDPVLIRTIMAFHQYNPDMQIIVALPPGQKKYWQTICNNHKFNVPHILVNGGSTRHHTVKNAVKKIQPGSIVAIHDGVRPLVSKALIQTCFDTASILGNAVPVIELSDSIREVNGDKNVRADRSRFRLVQTPQVFRSDMLIQAFRQQYKPIFTDEATLVESAGYNIHLVKGHQENIKITTVFDLCIAASLLENC